MALRLSAFRLKKALIDLENRIANTSMVDAKAVRLNRERLRADANNLEAQIAAVEADAEASADTSFTAPRRDSIQENSLVHLRKFIGRLSGRVDALLALFAVLSVSPNTGPAAGGTDIQINGLGFESGATVDVGGAAATNVVRHSAQKITCTTPAGTAGARDVVVTNSGPTTAALTGGFTYT